MRSINLMLRGWRVRGPYRLSKARRSSSGSLDIDNIEGVILKVSHLYIRSEDRGSQSDGISWSEQPIGFQRFEDVTHGGRPAFNRIQVKLAGRFGVSTHGPHQVLVSDSFIV